MTDWPNKKDLPKIYHPYYDQKENIYENENLLFIGKKLIVPQKLHDYILK